MVDLHLGLLTFIGETRGYHVHVSILGAGLRGQRPLCGTVVMRSDEFASLAKLLEVQAEQDRTIGELRKQLSEATREKWAACDEPPEGDGVRACGWVGEMSMLVIDGSEVTHCPGCGSTAIKEDITP